MILLNLCSELCFIELIFIQTNWAIKKKLFVNEKNTQNNIFCDDFLNVWLIIVISSEKYRKKMFKKYIYKCKFFCENSLIWNKFVESWWIVENFNLRVKRASRSLKVLSIHPTLHWFTLTIRFTVSLKKIINITNDYSSFIFDE